MMGPDEVPGRTASVPASRRWGDATHGVGDPRDPSRRLRRVPKGAGAAAGPGKAERAPPEAPGDGRLRGRDRRAPGGGRRRDLPLRGRPLRGATPGFLPKCAAATDDRDSRDTRARSAGPGATTAGGRAPVPAGGDFASGAAPTGAVGAARAGATEAQDGGRDHAASDTRTDPTELRDGRASDPGAGAGRRAGGWPRRGANAHAGEAAHGVDRGAGGGSAADAGTGAFRGARAGVRRARVAALRRGRGGS